MPSLPDLIKKQADILADEFEKTNAHYIRRVHGKKEIVEFIGVDYGFIYEKQNEKLIFKIFIVPPKQDVHKLRKFADNYLRDDKIFSKNGILRNLGAELNRYKEQIERIEPQLKDGRCEVSYNIKKIPKNKKKLEQFLRDVIDYAIRPCILFSVEKRNMN